MLIGWQNQMKFFWRYDYAFRKRAVLRKAERLLINFILEAASNKSFSKHIHWQIHNFRKKGEQQQRDAFPAFYLFVEQFLFGSQANQQDFREALLYKFRFVIERIPALHIIFLKTDEQTIALARLFLIRVLEETKVYFGKAKPSWLAEWENILRLKEDNLSDLIRHSQGIYEDFANHRGERSAIRAFNVAFGKLQVCYQGLACFPELLKLFPERALDETKFNQLTREQIKERLLEKVTMLEALSLQLRQKGHQIESQNRLLTEQTGRLDEQNQQLAEARMLIEMMNEELNKYNRQMEQKVRERTLELERSNLLLQHSNQNLEQYTFAISHQLKAPVSRILGLANLAALVDEHERTLMLTSIKDCAGELNGVLKDLVISLNLKNDVANVVKQTISLGKTLQEIFTKCCDSRIHPAVALAITGDAEIVTDLTHLTASVSLIFSNCLKFRKSLEPLKIVVSIETTFDHAVITISDNGVGFDADLVRHKLFMPFSRFNLEHEGRGMGLYLAMHHVQVIGGTISLESALQQGTTVRICLPTT